MARVSGEYGCTIVYLVSTRYGASHEQLTTSSGAYVSEQKTLREIFSLIVPFYSRGPLQSNAGIRG